MTSEHFSLLWQHISYSDFKEVCCQCLETFVNVCPTVHPKQKHLSLAKTKCLQYYENEENEFFLFFGLFFILFFLLHIVSRDESKQNFMQ